MMNKRSRRLSIQPLESRRLLAAVDIPDSLTGAAAAIVSVPVNIDNANAVRGAEIRISYNTTLLDLDANDITAGSVWTGNDTQVTANVNDAAGTVVIFVSASAGLPTSSGSLVVLPFRIAGSAAIGSTAALDLTSVTLNEGQIDVTPAPVAGTDSTDGLITIVSGNGNNGEDTIAGFVYADTNNNNTVETPERIPGVVITLTNTSTGQVRTATTNDQGRYEFSELPVGTYQVVQSQPIAYLDGGVNQFSVNVVTGQTIVDQNFRELGLRPQYLYNRLHTTLVRPIASAAWFNTIQKINVDAIAAASTVAAIAPAAALSTTSTTAPATSQSAITTPSTPSSSQAAGEPIAAQAFAQPTVIAPLAANKDSDKLVSNDDSVTRDRILSATYLW
jgi:hypothetical protein